MAQYEPLNPPQVGETIAGFSREQVVEALEQDLWEMWSNFGRGPGCRLFQEDGAIWYDTPIPYLPYHALIRFIGDHDLDRRIDRIVAHFATLKVPFMWIVHPSSPVGLAERLETRGLQEAEVLPGMAADLAQMPEAGRPPDRIEVREALSKEDFEKVFEMIAWRWEVPEPVRDHVSTFHTNFKLGAPEARARVWFALDKGKIISKAVYHRGSVAAGLYGVATKPEARGLGLAPMVTLAAFKAAREEGYRLAVLHSSTMALSLYRKLGFRTMAEFVVYASAEMHI